MLREEYAEQLVLATFSIFDLYLEQIVVEDRRFCPRDSGASRSLAARTPV